MLWCLLFIAFVHLSGIVFVIAGIFVTVVKKGSGKLAS
ncbi:hypothetical protein CHCC14821_2400 [Bacillus paralicheniformis]|nr:hypothetical protein CHCC14821_2400 [Bacillus paralicheniformis]